MKSKEHPDPRGLNGMSPRTGYPHGLPDQRHSANQYGAGGPSTRAGNEVPGAGYGPTGPPRDNAEYQGFQEHSRRSRSRICVWCGGIMKKSTRRVLSAMAGCMLVILGAILMVLYGLAINFFEVVPWYATFALPAGYYLGALFIGAGLLMFFIRERVWFCPNCRQMDKR